MVRLRKRVVLDVRLVRGAEGALEDGIEDDVGDALDEGVLLALAGEEGGEHELMVRENLRDVAEDLADEALEEFGLDDGGIRGA